MSSARDTISVVAMWVAIAYVASFPSSGWSLTLGLIAVGGLVTVGVCTIHVELVHTTIDNPHCCFESRCGEDDDDDGEDENDDKGSLPF